MMEIRAATKADADYIAEHLRDADIAELRASGKNDPVLAVNNSVSASVWAEVVLADGKPTVLYGVAKVDDKGIPWMLATEDIKLIGRKFIVGSMQSLTRMEREYRLLCNLVHRDNSVSIRWLRWLGFVIDPTPAGPDEKFFWFWKECKNV